MPVNEHGEIGVVLEYTEYQDAYDGQTKGLAIEWRVLKTGSAAADQTYGERVCGTWKKGDKIYYTSGGWIHVPDEHVFMPTERERSLKPCVLRATDYAKKKWPKARIETH